MGKRQGSQCVLISDALDLAIMYSMAHNPNCNIIFIVCLVFVHFMTWFLGTRCNKNGEYPKSFKCGVWVERCSVCQIENHPVTEFIMWNLLNSNSFRGMCYFSVLECYNSKRPLTLGGSSQFTILFWSLF